MMFLCIMKRSGSSDILVCNKLLCSFNQVTIDNAHKFPALFVFHAYNLIICISTLFHGLYTVHIVWRIQTHSVNSRSITWNPFRQISVEFSTTYMLSLETLEHWLEFKVSFCGSEHSLATQHGFEWWTGKVKQYTAKTVIMILMQPTLMCSWKRLVKSPYQIK